jgi:prepilin-type N-terminal cleavage/methylation domain-containing protein
LDVITLIFRHFRNNKGVTLVELLAALSLFAIVMVLVSTTIFQLFKGEDQASNQIEATQLANIALQDLKSQYNNNKDKICLDETYNKIEIHDTSNGTVNSNKNCIENIDSDRSLSITINSHSQTRNPINVKTTWNNKNDIGLNVILVDGTDETIIIDEEQLEQANCQFIIDNGESFIITAQIITRPCTIEGSGVFERDIQFDKHTGNIVGSVKINGDVTFDGSISFVSANPNDIEISIIGDAIFNDDIIFDKNQTEIVVTGNAYFNGDIKLVNNPQSSLRVTGEVYCNNEKIGESITFNSSKSCSTP